MTSTGNIYFNVEHQKWHARKYRDHHQHHLGYFDTREQAVKAVEDFMSMHIQDYFKKVSKQQVIDLTRKYAVKHEN